MEKVHLNKSNMDVYVRKIWAEEGITFYIMFVNGKAVSQVEERPTEVVYLTIDNPVIGESMLYDQPLEELDLANDDYITKEEYLKVWNTK